MDKVLGRFYVWNYTCLFPTVYSYTFGLNLWPVRDFGLFYIYGRKALPLVEFSSSFLKYRALWFLMMCTSCFLKLFLSVPVPLVDTSSICFIRWSWNPYSVKENGREFNIGKSINDEL